ncbi:MAG: hypothetical protein U0V02_09040 [Anaerolineales bacterium]
MFSNSNDPYMQGNTLRPSEQQRLDEAYQLYKEGKPSQAAPLFARIAEVLTENRQAQRAANLHALAAQAFAESGNESLALVQARAALKIFLQLKMEKRTQYFYNSISKELTKHGMDHAAESLKKEFAAKVSPPAESSMAARFPTNCPQCGAPVHISDAHGLNVAEVECGFCGTPIRPSA